MDSKTRLDAWIKALHDRVISSNQEISELKQQKLALEKKERALFRSKQQDILAQIAKVRGLNSELETSINELVSALETVTKSGHFKAACKMLDLIALKLKPVKWAPDEAKQAALQLNAAGKTEDDSVLSLPFLVDEEGCEKRLKALGDFLGRAQQQLIVLCAIHETLLRNANQILSSKKYKLSLSLGDDKDLARATIASEGRYHVIKSLAQALLESKQKSASTDFAQEESLSDFTPTNVATLLQTATETKSLSPILTKLYNNESFAISCSDELRSVKLTPTADKAFDVIYIVPNFQLYGGVITVIEIVNRLVKSGLRAAVAAYGKVDPELSQIVPLEFKPLFFNSAEELIMTLPSSALIMATHWHSVYPALATSIRQHSKLSYFIQGYEPEFYEDADTIRQAETTYKLIPDSIVTNGWLESKITPFGNKPKIISLGLDLSIFRDFQKTRKMQILSVARPSKFRNLEMLKRVYEEIYQLFPEVELALCGFGYDPLEFCCPINDYGKLSNLEAMAAAYNESTILLDCTLFQGFGRPGLEAMACGTATVLTKNGGITEYARDEQNTLLIDPTNKDEIIRKLSSLVSNESLRQSLVLEGKSTALNYSLDNQAQGHLSFIKSL